MTIRSEPLLSGPVHQHQERAESKPSARRLRGCFRNAAIGCGGMIVGSVIVLLGEILAVRSVPKLLDSLAPKEYTNICADFDDTRNKVPYDPDPMPEFCRTGSCGISVDEKTECLMWLEAHTSGPWKGM